MNKKMKKQIKSFAENIYLPLLFILISSIAGFGMFSLFFHTTDVRLVTSIFFGLMISASMMDILVSLYRGDKI